jgi:hypothetical protein
MLHHASFLRRLGNDFTIATTAKPDVVPLAIALEAPPREGIWARISDQPQPIESSHRTVRHEAKKVVTAPFLNRIPAQPTA